MPRPQSPRLRRIQLGLLPLLLSGVAALNALGGATPLRAQAPAAPSPGARPSTSAAAEQMARQAAERILQVVSRRDARGYYALLAPDSQRVSSPAMIGEAFRLMPQLRSWTITEVIPGFDSSNVAVTLQTSIGSREVLLILDGSGRMENFTVNASDQKAEVVVRQFIDELSRGSYLAAGSHLSPELQEDLKPEILQRRWQQLQRITGDFKRVEKIWKAESNATMKLVIVTTRFNRLTDNLFVVLNNNNQITAVNFPTEPNAPADALP